MTATAAFGIASRESVGNYARNDAQKKHCLRAVSPPSVFRYRFILRTYSDASEEVLFVSTTARCLKQGTGYIVASARTKHDVSIEKGCGKTEMTMGNKIFCVKIQNVDEFDCLKEFFAKGCPDVKWGYRGQCNYEWSLRPTIERMVKSNSEELPEKEACMIRRFKEMLGINCDDNGHRDCIVRSDDYAIAPYLAVMQHYAIPTRLLDFSRSFDVGLFFASLQQSPDDRGKDRAIWALRLNSIEEWTKVYMKGFQEEMGCSHERAPLLFADMILQKANGQTGLTKRILPLMIERNSPRMIAQHGLFVMPLYPGHFEVDLQETLGSGSYGGWITKHSQRLSVCKMLEMSPEQAEEVAVLKIEYPDSINGAVEGMLKDKHITHESMFPEMRCIKCKINREFCS